LKEVNETGLVHHDIFYKYIIMPLSAKHKIIFLHIAKNAGTSFCKALDMVPNHHRWRYYKKNHPKEWSAFNKFAIVRNPFDRVVSSYEYAKMETSRWHSARGAKYKTKHLDYDLLISKSFKETLNILINHPDKLKHQGWGPQHVYICNSTGDIMVDKILRFESLNEDFSKFFEGYSLDTVNPSNRKHYTEYYDDETKQIVAEKYAKDIEYFNYKFGE
jgi:chondroitin 4-sulfotransferase 11